MEKTNVMRLLDSKKINYKVLKSTLDPAINSAEDFAIDVGIGSDRMYKTLVTEAKSKKNYVFVIPADKELDLKKCAKAVGEKSIEMVKSKLLLELTGYVHGGCSPFMMKKLFTTVISCDALNQDAIVINAGRIGSLIEIKTKDISKIIKVKFDDVCT